LFVSIKIDLFKDLKMAVSRFQMAANKKGALSKQQMREIAVRIISSIIIIEIKVIFLIKNNMIYCHLILV